MRAITPGTPCIPAPTSVTLARPPTDSCSRGRAIASTSRAASAEDSGTVKTRSSPAGVNMSSETPASAIARYTRVCAAMCSAGALGRAERARGRERRPPRG